MHKIYFEKRCIIICSPEDPALSDPNALLFRISEGSDIHQLVEMVEISESLHRVFVPTHDTEDTYLKICSEFKEVNAGGGLVQNSAGEYLLIHRNGMWDLPKGKQEEGEDIALTALREVEEECGISNLEQGELLCITHHTYRMHGLHMLKHTYWYNMKYSGDCSVVVPQVEEGIQQCRWVPAAGLPELLKDTYPSIRQVFVEAGLL